jgi:DNA-binding XRE family transcriptional regulator
MVPIDQHIPTSGQFRAARALLALSQDDLAALSGTSRRTIVSMESGSGQVMSETLRAVVKALDSLGITFFATEEMVGVKRQSRPNHVDDKPSR